MKELSSEIEINAPASRIWRVLTDFESYSRWNPFIQRASGKAEKGNQLKLYFKAPGSFGMTFKPVVLKAEAKKELRWLGKLLVSGLFDGEHAFILEEAGRKTALVQKERFSGLLVPLLGGKFYENTELGFEQMNAALKKRVEGK